MPWNVFWDYCNLIFAQHAAQTNFYYFFSRRDCWGMQLYIIVGGRQFIFSWKEKFIRFFCLLNALMFSTIFPNALGQSLRFSYFPDLYIFSSPNKKWHNFLSYLGFFITFFVFTVYTFSLGVGPADDKNSRLSDFVEKNDPEKFYQTLFGIYQQLVK